MKYISQGIICNICFENFPTDSFLSLSCNCSFCPSCLFQWILTSLRSQSVNLKDPEIRCPNENCKSTYPLNQLKSHLIQEQLSTIDDILLLKYLQNADDIINCPSSDCRYYGLKPIEQCIAPFECLKCGNIWEDEKILERKRGFLKNFFNKDVLSWIYEEVFTKSCPKCGIYIYHAGGCQHMTCKKCEYEFCWRCKQNYNQHKGNICTNNSILQLFFLLFHLMLCMWKFKMGEKLVFIFSFMINFILKYMLFYNGFFAITVYFLYYVNYSYKYGNEGRRTTGGFGIYTVGGLALYCFFLLLIYGNFIEFFVFILSEVLIIFAGLSIGLLFNLLWTRWLYIVE